MLLGFGSVAAWNSTAEALNPKSPEVQEIVAGANQYLQSSKPYHRIGGKCLVALALYKSGTKPDHPLIKNTVQDCKRFAAKVPKFEHDAVYDAGMVLILLCELDPYSNHQEIENLVTFFVKNQKAHGGYGYSDKETGDNSMTQYAALGLWLAKANSFDVPIETIASLTNWVMSVQDPSGAFGYQGVISPRGKPRVQQSDIRPSLTTAGLCSLYVSANALDLGGQRKKDDSDVPDGFTEINEEKQADNKKARDLVDTGALQSVKDLGNDWMTKHFTVEGTRWQLYYLYALERYKAFEELDTGKPDPDPMWYKAGFEFIKKCRQKDGSIKAFDEDHTIGSAFSILFLVRGTTATLKKHVKSFDNGLLAGGRGLPTDLSEAELRNGQVINVKEIPETKKFLEMLNSDDGSLDDLVDADVALDLDLNGADREIALKAVRRKLRQGSYASRIMAIRAIKGVKDFESVPDLIYALSDPDLRVAKEARDALRFVSRKIDGFGMPLDPTPPEREMAIQKWKDWYLSLRPNAIFLN
ncbi:hypothetical protein DTL21_11070 [Bremerella cremea]|uniref:Squalene cyclase C-terminal domain-containing protein n=2 Tax=Pirellulales TaxID=2691354 RepID=A0A2S8FPH4_9BACT|nr:hypothetical protein C5Y83_11065 [Blastopirellula marina]RCS46576.1 hypothetical protein DTL21_11070 [Bremerella cremea]